MGTIIDQHDKTRWSSWAVDPRFNNVPWYTDTASAETMKAQRSDLKPVIMRKLNALLKQYPGKVSIMCANTFVI